MYEIVRQLKIKINKKANVKEGRKDKYKQSQRKKGKKLNSYSEYIRGRSVYNIKIFSRSLSLNGHT